jgi:hypothetical protein
MDLLEREGLVSELQQRLPSGHGTGMIVTVSDGPLSDEPEQSLQLVRGEVSEGSRVLAPSQLLSTEGDVVLF